MIDKAIQNLARKNSDNIEIKISNKINNENDFNNNIEVLNKSKPSYLTWSNVQSEITLLEQAEADAINKKASAKEKLLALGLTEEEIKLTFGI